MKHRKRYLGFLLLFLLLSACQAKKTNRSGTSSSTNNLGSTTGTSTGGSFPTVPNPPPFTPTPSTTSGVNSGSTGGSTGGSTPAQIFVFNVQMAGGFSWYPGFYPGGLDTNVHDGDFYELSDSNIAVFQSDSRYKIRVKVLPERFITSTDNGRDVCYDRQQGSQYPNVYSKVAFTIAIRDVFKNGSVYSVGPRYAAKSSGSVNVNNYSAIFDWSAGQFPTRNAAGGTLVGHTFEIYNVLSDVYCNPMYPSYCNLTAHVVTRCWSLQAELATDVTQDF